MISNCKIKKQKKDLSQINDNDLVFSIKNQAKKKIKISFFNNNYKLAILIIYQI